MNLKPIIFALTLSTVTSLALATTTITCPTGPELSQLPVGGQTAADLYYTNPGFVDAKHSQCAVGLFVVSPSASLVKTVLAKAKLFRSEPESNVLACFYDQIPGRDLGYVTVLTYTPVNGSCTSNQINFASVGQYRP
jgi:hypothetical protein